MAEVYPKKAIEFSRVRVDKINLNPLNADPTDATYGDIWYRGDIDAFRVMLVAGVKTITVA